VASSVSSTVNTKQIENLPLTSRNVMDFVTFLPGVQTAGGLRQSSINGLPRAAINITLDGVNVQDNTLRSSDGFFTIVQPRLDAIEEVTVSTAAGETAGGASGAVQIRFTTRSGSNALAGSLYHYYRNDTWKVFGKTLNLNMNTWFNNRNGVAKPKRLQNQRGGRLGGPIVIPGLYDGRGKAFFFTNIENFNQPSQVTRNRTIFHEQARAGVYRYLGAGGSVQEVNLLTLAANNGQLATMDPVIQKLLADIRQATGTTGSIIPLANPLHEQYTYNVDAKANNWFPTYRLDYNFTNNHRFSTILNWHTFSSLPDTLNRFEPFFPGFPVFGSQTSRRGSSSNTLRSTLGQNFVNEARVSYQSSPVEFFNEMFDASIWNQSFGGQGGFHLLLGAGGISDADRGPSAQSRNVYTTRVENTLSWQKGSHSFSFGGSFERVDSWNKFKTTVPTIAFDVLDSDPAKSMFTAANFPGASSTQLGAAENMYALLTGRVSSLTGTARVDAATGKYVFAGLGLEESRLDEYGVFAQDSWRVRPNLSVNVGLRWDVQAPFRAKNSSYATATIDSIWGVSGYVPGCDLSNATPQTCNLFKPGTMPGSPGVFERWNAGTPAYNVDWNNLAPSIGFNWAPDRADGLLGTLMGASGDFAIRGGIARSFQRPAMGDLRARFSGNSGLAISVARNESRNNLGANPLLLRDSPTAPSFSEDPVFPNLGEVTDDINAFDPNIQVPYSDSWTIGIQRGLTKNMAAEVRYVGTRSRQQWFRYDYNEVNIIENGFLDEFKLAQANLQANVAAGRGGNFRYYGPGTGTSPLPIHLAYFSGVSAANAGDPARYGSSLFQNSTFLNPLARFNPNPFTAANALDANGGRRANALKAGLPANFLVANPDKLGGARVEGNGNFSDYNSVQFELRRRLANGIQFNASYVYGVGTESVRYSFRVPRETRKSAGTTEGEVTHAFKINWMLELPFGRGKRFGSNAGGVLDRIIGGWQIHGNARIQSGIWVDFGNVNMVGFNEKDLRKMFKLRIDENQRVFMLPQDVVDETVKAFSTNPTSASGYSSQGAPTGRYFAPAMGPNCLETVAAGYGDCGTRTLTVRGPAFKEVDISIMKLMPIVKRIQAEFRVEMLNAFNSVNYVPIASTSNNPANHELTGLTGTNSARVIQLVTRITW
ncbi:MAG: Plug domain-containing protein, partial [Acidobacteria bacterium]|nr:Plug domain-containing protein [Acidobacteriota bacterium]